MFDVRRKIEGAEETDLVSVTLEDFGDLKGQHGPVRVSGDGVWSMGLPPLDAGVVGGHAFGDIVEGRLARVEASGSQSMDGPILDEPGEADEDQDLSDAWMDEPDGSFLPLRLKSDDGIVPDWVFPRSSSALASERHHRDHRDLLGQTEFLLDALLQLDELDGRDAHLEHGRVDAQFLFWDIVKHGLKLLQKHLLHPVCVRLAFWKARIILVLASS